VNRIAARPQKKPGVIGPAPQPVALSFQDISVGQGGLAVKIGVSEERFQALSEELGVTHGALRNFFKILEENQVALDDLDHTLREIAGRYNELLQQLLWRQIMRSVRMTVYGLHDPGRGESTLQRVC
jgi:hypothetical protein